jgi:phage tail-like protein
MATGERADPYRGFRFRIEIDGISVAHFSEVSGLQADTETEPYEEGGVNDYVHQLPKRTKYPHITLKRGITDVDELWNWHQDVVSGRFKRKNGSIILLNEAGEDTWRWNFTKAFPVKWTGPDLKADSATVAFEAIDLAHNGISKG